jgi:hypothetical protein
MGFLSATIIAFDLHFCDQQAFKVRLKRGTGGLFLTRLNFFQLTYGPANRVRAGFMNSGMHFLGKVGKHGTIAGRQMNHLQSMATDTNGVQGFLYLFHPGLGPEIALFVMTVSFPASHQINPVGPLLKGSHEMQGIDFSGAGDTNNLDARRVTQAHRTCQVRSGIPSVIATKSDNDRFKILAHKAPSNKVSILHKS